MEKKKLMNRKQAAEYLGVAYGSMNNFIKKYKPPHFKVGKKCLFDENQLKEYLEQNSYNQIKGAY